LLQLYFINLNFWTGVHRSAWMEWTAG